MKRSSVILLWISLLWFFPGIIFSTYGAAALYRLLHTEQMVYTADGVAIPIRDISDFAEGTVVHIDWGGLGILIPAITWLIVWSRERAALRTRLGRWTTWLGLLYMLIFIAMTIWFASFATVSN